MGYTGGGVILAEQGFDSSIPDPEERASEDTVGGRLLDATLRHRHFVLRAENGMVREIVEPLREADRSLARDLGLLILAGLSLRAIRNFQARLDETLRNAQPDTEALARQLLTRFGLREAEIQANLYSRYLGNGFQPPPVDIDGLVDAPLGGRRFPDRMARNFRETRALAARLASIARLADIGTADEAQALENLGRRLRAQLRQTLEQRTVMTVRTEAQRIANGVSQRMLAQNQSLLSGLQVVEILDSRTCLICAGLDGQVFPVGQLPDGGPPFHANCRGAVVPVPLGEDPPVMVSYEEWFNRQPASFQRQILGPSRFRRFQRGDLRVTEFARDLRILSLEELPIEAEAA